MYFDENGVIKDIQADRQGVEKVNQLNPYETISAVTFAWQAGVNVRELESSSSNQPKHVVTEIDHGDWLALSSVDFSQGISEVIVKVASELSGGSIELRLDKVDGERLGELTIPNTDGLDNWENVSSSVTSVTGVHDVYFIFKGESDQQLFEVMSWSFKK